MRRHTLSVVTAAVLAAIVGAQGPKAPSPAQRGELFKKNRPVIEKLVDQTLDSARTPNDYVKRADTYYHVLYKFNTEIAEANRDNDPARVEELTRHLGTLLDKGLAPTLVKAREQVENGTGNEDYRRVKETLLAQVRALLDMLAGNPSATASLEGAKRKLDDINGPRRSEIAGRPGRRNDARRRTGAAFVRFRTPDGPPPDTPRLPPRAVTPRPRRSGRRCGSGPATGRPGPAGSWTPNAAGS